MRTKEFSMRRRQVVMGAVAAVPLAAYAKLDGAAPARVTGARAIGAGEAFVLSGRLVDRNSNAVSGATIEVLGASGVTDGDGRFFISATAAHDARHFEYRVTHGGDRSPVRRVHFSRAAPAGHAHIAQLERDRSGVWRSTFAATLA